MGQLIASRSAAIKRKAFHYLLSWGQFNVSLPDINRFQNWWYRLANGVDGPCEGLHCFLLFFACAICLRINIFYVSQKTGRCGGGVRGKEQQRNSDEVLHSTARLRFLDTIVGVVTVYTSIRVHMNRRANRYKKA
ncbi:hypothetical protein TRVL_09017 [Trypanosoma vivax]|uniref:Uncharacterized protein n=1 Tax=Trypanosoma vivax (strain Y486) TaxID=1055687 RepID=G0TTF0_TRYVY|nr:hypothetical protein TRVL_09017 [Trypanosoma vivax]CCC47231.1 hypothetical protein, unlikely [Trypanosoma vivax Y486]